MQILTIKQYSIHLLAAVALLYAVVSNASGVIAQSNSGLDNKLATYSKTFIYSIRVNGVGVGKLHSTINANDQSFKIETVTKPNRIAGLLLGGNVIDQCEFSLQENNHILGENYSTLKKGNSKFAGDVLYNWDKQQLVFNQSKITNIPDGYILDNCNLYAAMSLSKLATLPEQKIIVLDANESRYRAYGLGSMENEDLKTIFGTIETRKLTLVRDNNPDRKLIFWVSSQYPASPLKIVDLRKHRRVEAKLRSIKQN